MDFASAGLRKVGFEGFLVRYRIAPFSVPAVAKVELVAEKLRTLVQRAQPRDLFDLQLYLVESGWHLDPADLRRAVDAKLALTRHRRWRSGMWRLNLEAIERAWDETSVSGPWNDGRWTLQTCMSWYATADRIAAA